MPVLVVLIMVGCGNRPQPSVITVNAKLMEQTDSIVRDIYERDTIQGDFNGDGKIEHAYSESNPTEYYNICCYMRLLFGGNHSTRYATGQKYI